MENKELIKDQIVTSRTVHVEIRYKTSRTLLTIALNQNTIKDIGMHEIGPQALLDSPNKCLLNCC